MISLFAGFSLASEPEPTDPAEPTGSADVVVTSARTEQLRKDATVAVVVIDREALAASGASTLAEFARTIPGLDVVETYGGAGLSLQGLDPKHTLILVDGRARSGRTDGTIDLARFPVDQIERIEIVNGPASVLYGSDALGGVVNIITRRSPRGMAHSLTARVGTLGTFEAAGRVSGRSSRVEASLGAQASRQDALDRDLATDGTTQDARRAAEADGRVSATLSDHILLEASGAYAQRTRQGVDGLPTGAVLDRTGLEEDARAGTLLTAFPGAEGVFTADLSTSLWRRQALVDQRDSDVQDSYSDSRDNRFALALAHRQPMGSHLLVIGLDGVYASIQTELVADGAATGQRVALYAQDDWTVTKAPRLTLAPGVRLDVDDAFGLAPTPRMAVRFDPATAVELRGSFGLGYRAPDFKELYLDFDHSNYGYVVVGNPDLQPERSWGGTADVDVRAHELLTLHLNGWWSEVSDLIDVALLSEGSASEAAQYTYVNVARARTRGGTVSVASSPGPVHLSLGYTLTHAWDVELSRLLQGRALHQGTGSVGIEHDVGPLVVFGDGRLRVSGPRPYYEDVEGAQTTVYTKPTIWLDASGGFGHASGFRLSVGVRNLLDAQDDTYLSLPPRVFWVGLSQSTL